MIRSSIRRGIGRVWAVKRLIGLYFLFSFLFALLIALPLRSVLASVIGQSLVGAELAGSLDMDFVFELFKQAPSLPSAFFGLVIIVPTLFWLLLLFLSGGSISCFVSDSPYRPGEFWGNSGNYFARFLRLTLWSLPIGLLLLALQYIETGLERLIFGNDPYQYISYWGNWIRFGLRLFGIILFFVLFDYARIYIVIHDETKTRRALWHAVRFVGRHFGPTFGLSASLFFIGILGLVAYNLLSGLLNASSGLAILLLFLAQQTFILFRVCLRLTYFASQVHLYRSISPEDVQMASDTGNENQLATVPV